jgi:hypothetical protein
VGFVVFLITYLFECVDYKILFNIEAPPGKKHGEKVLLNDVIIPFGECATKFSFKVNLYIIHCEITFSGIIVTLQSFKA